MESVWPLRKDITILYETNQPPLAPAPEIEQVCMLCMNFEILLWTFKVKDLVTKESFKVDKKHNNPGTSLLWGNCTNKHKLDMDGKVTLSLSKNDCNLIYLKTF